MAILTSWIGAATPAHASPTPPAVTVGAGGAAPASAAISGGPLTGTGDAGGLAPPVSCSAPACESFAITLRAPTGWAASHDLGLTAVITFTASTPATGVDEFLLDGQGKVLGQYTSSASPATVSAAHLQPGSYSLEVTGDVGTATSYAGTVQATSKALTVSGPALPAQLAFAPSSVVSPVILGAEPQVSFEVPRANGLAGATNPQRGFVDWPLSSRSNIGTLWRTLDGGDVWRQIVDLQCAERQRPNCFTGGGGDTVNRVNNYNGDVLFGDQEALAAEAFAMSKDHGDTFPLGQQQVATAAGTVVDRQWISAAEGRYTARPVDKFPLDGIFSYHIPIVGEYVSGIDTGGLVHPALITTITNVSQSGNSRIDSSGGPGDGWFYQSYRTATGYFVATVPLSQYQSPLAYHVTQVTGDVPSVFPWIALDSHGNAYATWVDANGQLWLSYSLIDDKANNPRRGGAPGTLWSKQVQVNVAPLGSTIFPEIVAGDPGRVAIAYDASSDFTGIGDNAPVSPPATWRTYVSMSLDALTPSPTFVTGPVSHRIVHYGSICTTGTTCILPLTNGHAGDRSLLDMINIAADADGRVGVIYTDNNNQFAVDTASMGSEGNPYVMFAKLAGGPSLLSGHSGFATTYPTAFRGAARGDATWPNVASGTKLPALDVLGDGVFVDQQDVVARIDLADAGAAGMTRDLGAFNALRGTDLPAQRVQYVVRFAAGKDVWFLAFDQDTTGARRAYGGRITGATAITNGASSLGTTYDPQSGFTVTYQVQGNTLLLRGHLADYQLRTGDTLYSYSAFSLAGPTNQSLVAANADTTIFAIDRVVDGAPPMDAVLAGPSQQPPVPAGGPNGGPGPVATLPPPISPNTAAVAAAGTGPAVALCLLLVVMGTRRTRRRRHRPGGGGR